MDFFATERHFQSLASLASLKTHPPPPTPGASLIRRRPNTLSSPVRLRRRRRRRFLWREWTAAVASLKGHVLILNDAHSNEIIAAIDINSFVVNATIPLTDVSVLSAQRIVYRLRFPVDHQQWLRALTTVVNKTSPKLSDFTVVSPIGKGGGGEVYMVRHKNVSRAITNQNQPLAMKVVQKHDAFHTDGSLRHALDERLVMELVRGFPFVIQLTHAFQTESALYLISQFCQGGNLRTLLSNSPKSRLKETDAIPIMTQILLALEHIHSLNVVYRDLKPENILLDSTGVARVCDFGLSKVLATGRFGRTKSFCGSTSYMSPQIVSGKWYGIESDLWSLGALFYRMLVGRAPFDDSSRKLGANNDMSELHKRIQLDDVTYPSWLSEEAVEMLTGLLRKDESERLNLQDLKESLFFEGIDWDKVLEDGYELNLQAPVTPFTDEYSLNNFDTQKLISEGMTLRDKELEKQVDKSKLPVGGFKMRTSSKLTDLLSLRRNVRKQGDATSIVGFGYASDMSTIQSDVSRSSASVSRGGAAI